MRQSKGSGDSLSPQQMAQLAEFAAGFTHDPAGFVWAAFPWGEPGPLADQQPDPWQLSLLDDVGKGLKSPQQVIQEAVASGHGIGKSALVCWLIIWAMSTFEDCKGVVTANTQNQLLSKTWPPNGTGFPSQGHFSRTRPLHSSAWTQSMKRPGAWTHCRGQHRILKPSQVCTTRENASWSYLMKPQP